MRTRAVWSEGSMRIRSHIMHYTVKHYRQGSEYGINGGRISKLSLQGDDGVTLALYDRGWSKEPDFEEAKIAVSIIISNYD